MVASSSGESVFQESQLSPQNAEGELWSFFCFVAFKIKTSSVNIDELKEIFQVKLMEHPIFWKKLKIYIFPEIETKLFGKSATVSKMRLCLFATVKKIMAMIRFERAGNLVKTEYSKIIMT